MDIITFAIADGTSGAGAGTGTGISGTIGFLGVVGGKFVIALGISDAILAKVLFFATYSRVSTFKPIVAFVNQD